MSQRQQQQQQQQTKKKKPKSGAENVEMARAMIQYLLDELQPSLRTKKKDAITTFENYFFRTKPELTDKDILRLYMGGKNKQGLLDGCGQTSWKSFKLKKAAAMSLGLLWRLMDEQEHAGAVHFRRVFFGLSSSHYKVLKLERHLQEARGNRAAAKCIVNAIRENDASVAQREALRRQQEEENARKEAEKKQQAEAAAQKRKPPPPAAAKPVEGKGGIMDMLAKFFSRRPDRHELEKRGVLRKSAMFGQPLEKIAGPDGVPKVVKMCIQFLERHSVKERGLFRVSGDSVEIQELRKQFDFGSPEQIDQISFDDCNQHSVSGLLKLFFREMPEPLLTFERYEGCVDACRQEQFSKIFELCDSIPRCNRATLHFLLDFLARVSFHSAVNMMTTKNLAIVFAPNLLRPKVETYDIIARDTPVTIAVLDHLLRRRVDAIQADEQSKQQAAQEQKQQQQQQQQQHQQQQQQSSAAAAAAATEEAAAVADAGVEDDPAALPEPWCEYMDPATGNPFYYNPVTKKTQWQRPVSEAEQKRQMELARARQAGSAGFAAQAAALAAKAAAANKAADTAATATASGGTGAASGAEQQAQDPEDAFDSSDEEEEDIDTVVDIDPETGALRSRRKSEIEKQQQQQQDSSSSSSASHHHAPHLPAKEEAGSDEQVTHTRVRGTSRLPPVRVSRGGASHMRYGSKAMSQQKQQSGGIAAAARAQVEARAKAKAKAEAEAQAKAQAEAEAQAKAEAEAKAQAEQQQEQEQQQAEEDDNDGELPEGWQEFSDPASGRSYYYHAASQTTTWDRPAADANAEAGNSAGATAAGAGASAATNDDASAQEQQKFAHVHEIQARWDSNSSGGCFPNYGSWRSSPQIRLFSSSSKKTRVRTTLHRISDLNVPEEERAPVGLQLFKNNGPALQKLRVGDFDTVLRSEFVHWDSVAIEFDLEPPSDDDRKEAASFSGSSFDTNIQPHYTILVSSFEPGHLGTFSVKVESDDPIEAQLVTEHERWTETVVRGEWTEATAGGCRNHKSFESNPQYLLELGTDFAGTAKTLIVLSQETEELRAIGCYVIDCNGSIVGKAPFMRSIETEVLLDVSAAHAPYLLVPCTFNAGEQLSFVLRTFTPKAVTSTIELCDDEDDEE